MKSYIFLTADIHPVGGMQHYVAGKAKYLEENGWKVHMFFYGNNSPTCAIPSLSKYSIGGLYELSKQPYAWPSCIRKNGLKGMAELIGYIDSTRDEIIIESQSDITALWGELLAKKISAKHVCFNCNELFRGPNKCYWENINFFDFKHQRRELCGIQKESLGQLFEGHKILDDNEKYTFVAMNEGPIQDVENDKIEKIQQKEWNICYIGRAKKLYVDIIIADIAKFAHRHSSTDIQFIMVGNADSKKEILESMLGNVPNITLTLLGDLVPIPRKLYSKIDVVIAGSGCARFSAMEGVPVIVAEAKVGLSNGILGYTTFNALMKEKEDQLRHYDEMLEQVLVDKICEDTNYSMPPRENPEYYYDLHMKFVENSEKQKEYFNLNQKVEKVKLKEFFKYYILKHMPSLFLLYKGLKHEQ